MSQKYEKLLILLKELFQLDQPDLDFGLYRIMHAKSTEVEQFLEKDLLPQVQAAFELYKTADKREIEKELAKVVAAIEAAGMDPSKSPKVRELRERLESDAIDISALESEVYDHLFSFFRRYYSEGDFLAKRVYKPGVYAIPYEGEEVTLHWANKDQYYIKSSEYLRDYAFRLRPDGDKNPMRVHFRLVDAAEGEHGNVKAAEGKDRVFILAAPGESGQDFITEEDGEQGKELVIKFEFRPATLTDWPYEVREGKNMPPAQKDLIAISAKQVLTVTVSSLAPWIEELGKLCITASGVKADYTRLELHLKRYTARNTFDYFIHKNLGVFLRRELDFYIKNEVMHLDDVESEIATRVEQYISMIKVIRKIAGKIIDFLSQLEDFQKKLWLKKKFVIETQWCIKLGCIPEEFYTEIATNETQLEEWIKLYAIDQIKGNLLTQGYSKDIKLEFLKAHPTLVVDTRNFNVGFTMRLLEALGNIEEQTDGVLFHGENFQALSLMQMRYREQVKSIYIDPPYNTSASEIAYKNDYKHSSWLCMLSNSLDLAKRNLCLSEGVICCTIDDFEHKLFSQVIESHFGEIAGTVAIRIKPSGRPIPNGFAISHEYAVFARTNKSFPIARLEHSEEQKERYREIDGKGRYFWEMFRKAGSNSNRENRPTMFYPFYLNIRNGVLRLPKMEFDIAKQHYIILEELLKGEVEIYPIKDDGKDGRWYFGLDRAFKIINEFKAVLQDNGDYRIYYRRRSNEGIQPTTLWFDSKYSATEHGTALLKAIFGEQETFSYPKSIHAVKDCLSVSGILNNPNSLVLDFFAGSGTTGHAVINLNQEDCGRRKFILVEISDYFYTVLLPRIKKVTFTPEWKDGKPKRLATPEEVEHCPRIIKVIRLESYEDTLNNLETYRTNTQQILLESTEAQGEDGLKEQYILRYMLNVEMHGSQSLLNVQAFEDPMAYNLKVKSPGSDESSEVNVDLLETFNWLIGITVQHIAAPQTFSAQFECDGEKRLRLKGRLKQEADGPYWFRTVIGNIPDGRRTLIIWRKLTNKTEQDNLVLDEWFTKQGYSAKDSEFDIIYVNGSNNLENLKAPDDTWKVRLIEEDFHRLMFEIEDM